MNKLSALHTASIPFPFLSFNPHSKILQLDSTMPRAITRETFIDLARAEATALTQESMYDEDVEQVPIPESFRKFGVPWGYSVGALSSVLRDT